MLRSSLLLGLLVGCAAPEAEKTWGELPCEGEPQGHLDTLTWCGDQWRSWHAKQQAASAGTIVDGVFQPAHTMWWPDGKTAGRLENGQMLVFNESEQPLGTQAWQDGRPAACSGGTVKDEVLDSGHRQVSCVNAEEESIGRTVTFRADGSIESVQHWVDGERHGAFEAYHPSGEVWIQGEYAAGKKHGPWHSWTGGGDIYQASVQPAWKDHKPVKTWVKAAVSAP